MGFLPQGDIFAQTNPIADAFLKANTVYLRLFNEDG